MDDPTVDTIKYFQTMFVTFCGKYVFWVLFPQTPAAAYYIGSPNGGKGFFASNGSKCIHILLI